MKFFQVFPLVRASLLPQNRQDGTSKKTGARFSSKQIISSTGRQKVRLFASDVEGAITLKQQTVAPDIQDATVLQNEPTVKGVALRLHRRFFSGWELLIIAVVLLIAGLAHGINMFHYPYFEDDEGTYMSQASAVIHIGKLAYYTYWYDHAPVGWLQIALWLDLTGGDRTFGSIIFSGRILMLLMQLGSTFMVYYIARKVSGSVLVAVAAALLFALSPYGLYFHRRVLLDNVTTFWLLVTLLVLTTKRITLNRIWLSAATLCISILSKEITAFVVPVMAYLVYTRADKSNRWFAVIGWIVLVGVIISLYPLMAVLNSELFPMIFWNGTQADAQDMATSWIEDNVSPKSRILIDEYMWSDLYDDGYRYAHYYWKVQTDPAIRDTIFHDNWRNFDYVATTSQMLVDMQTQNMTLVKDVIDNSTLVAHFDTGGWRIEIRKVNK